MRSYCVQSSVFYDEEDFNFPMIRFIVLEQREQRNTFE